MSPDAQENPYEAPASEVFAPAEGPIDAPTTFGGKLAQGFQLFFGNFPLIAGVVLTVWFPANLLIELAFFGREDTSDAMARMQLNNVAEVLLGPIVNGALIGLLAQRMNGRKVGYGAAMGVGLRNWGRVFAARFFASLLIIVGLIALIVPGIILAVRYALIDEVVVLEGVAGPEVRARSTELVRGQGWQIVFTTVLLFATLIAVAACTGFLMATVPSFENLAGAVVADCVPDLVGALFTCVYFLIYWDARRRKPAAADPFLAAEPLSPAAEL
jgi:hypothetical protein